DLIMPLVAGWPVWLIKNATSGGQAIRVIGTTGSGVIIPNGQSALVTTDSTNFFAIVGTPAIGTSGQFLVINAGSNGMAWVTASGDLTLASTGAFTVTSATGTGTNEYTAAGAKFKNKATEVTLGDGTTSEAHAFVADFNLTGTGSNIDTSIVYAPPASSAALWILTCGASRTSFAGDQFGGSLYFWVNTTSGGVVTLSPSNPAVQNPITPGSGANFGLVAVVSGSSVKIQVNPPSGQVWKGKIVVQRIPVS
ncbi:MAG TPA: hypothetical protein VI159_09400, partial [Gemmatimonadales bacterium]